MEQKKLNASQRLEKLEYNMDEVSMHLNNMSRDILMLKEAIKLMGNKVDAIAKAAQISNETIDILMVQNNIDELKEKVDGFISQGVLVPSEAITASSFAIGQEVDDDGKVPNPRVQFAVGALNPEMQEKLIGAKVGDKVSFSEGTLKFEVTEIYEIVAPKAPETVEELQEEIKEA